jgi:hypothetical protein
MGLNVGVPILYVFHQHQHPYLQLTIHLHHELPNLNSNINGGPTGWYDFENEWKRLNANCSIEQKPIYI